MLAAGADLLLTHALVQKTKDHGGHRLTQLDDVPIRIVEAQDALPPGVLPHLMEQLYPCGFYTGRISVEVLAFKVELRIMGAVDRPLLGKARQRRESLLECGAAFRPRTVS